MFRNAKSRRGSAACALVFWAALGPGATSAAAGLSDSDTLMLADFADASGATRQGGLREALRAALDESPYLNLVPDAAIERATAVCEVGQHQRVGIAQPRGSRS